MASSLARIHRDHHVGSIANHVQVVAMVAGQKCQQAPDVWFTSCRGMSRALDSVCEKFAQLGLLAQFADFWMG